MAHFRMDQRNSILPYFPLSVFLFPGEDMPLHIFEPRYKQLIDEARTLGITFAVPFVIEQEIQEFGCEVRLKDVVAEKEDGHMVIVVESVAIVEITSYDRQLEGKLYAGGTVRRLPCDDPVVSQELLDLITSYREYYDQEFLSGSGSEPVSRKDLIIALNLSSDEKFKFICMPDAEQREGFLAGQLRYLSMIRRQEALLGDDFGLN
ncbi:MAG: LON peptidase substrate-binding domain-containing protein [Bacteroidota bacterium]|nr:LON peptidase substrate-binding domain-containing protein [Bacteroidota bacterium]